VPDPTARQIVSQRLAAHRQGTWTSLAAFLEECATPEIQSLITELTTDERALPNPAQQLADVALRLRNQFLDRQLAALIHQANQLETPEPQRLELLRQQQALRSLKRRPLTPATGQAGA
jgi:hypothetical protein